MEQPKIVHDLPHPYRRFSASDWSQLDHAITVPDDLSAFEGCAGAQTELDLGEIRDIYAPLVGLLLIERETALFERAKKQKLLNEPRDQSPFIVGLAGSVAAGKSTFARVLQRLIALNAPDLSVDLLTTDGFLYPNAILEQYGIMNRKGFPESYNQAALSDVLFKIRSGAEKVSCPVYSHMRYDILPDEQQIIDKPDILIVEGVNVLQSRPRGTSEQPAYVSDFFDFSLFLDADEQHLQDWYVSRFLLLKETSFTNDSSYFRAYSHLNEEKAIEKAKSIWKDINLKNLHQNIGPTKNRANCILKKGADHKIDQVRLRII